MAELSDAHAMAIERSCAVTAVALSGQRREGVRLVTGEHRGFSLSSALDFVHVPYPSIGRDWTRRTLTCGVALQCSPSKERLVEYRLNELSARELRALTLVEAGVALGWIAASWPGLLAEVRRCCPTRGVATATWTPARCSTVRSALARSRTATRRRSAARQIAVGLHDAAGTVRQAAPQLRPNALDHNAEAASAAVLGTRRRRRRRPQPQPAAAEPAAGQRPRHHPGPPSRDSLSGVERVDEELHARSRRGARARARQSYAPSRERRPPTCGSGSRSTPIAR